MSDLNEIVMNVDTELTEEEKKSRETFLKLGPVCAIYGILFTVFLFDNFMSVTMPLWVIAAEGLILWALKVHGQRLKNDSIFVMAIMSVIGISTFLTGNGYTVFLNYCAEFLLIVTLLIHNFADDLKWDFGTYFGRIIGSSLGALGYVMTPFRDYGAYRRSKNDKNENVRRVVRGLIIAVPCLFILGWLLASADLVFGDMVGDMFRDIEFDEPFRFILMMLFGIFSAYCGIRYVSSNIPSYEYHEPKKSQPLTAITVLAVVLILYAVFSGIQIAYLFTGHMELPAGITYAEYARTGFFQLLAVCVIDLVSVLLIKKYSQRSKLLDGMLIAIVVCTAIMAASSVMRMLMYIGAYGLTYLRIFVLTALAAIAILLAGVVVKILKEEFSFFRYGVAVIGIIYAAFALSSPDRLTAEYNIAHRDQIELDTWYLADLSSDAAEVIGEYIIKEDVDFNSYAATNRKHDDLFFNENRWAERYAYYVMEDAEKISFRTFNLSQYRAGQRMKEIIELKK